MRKVFKPENVVKKEKTVKIPDVEFINDTTAQADDSEGKTVLTEEVYNKILEKVLNDNSGEIGRRRLKAAHERDVIIHNARLEAQKILSEATASSQIKAGQETQLGNVTSFTSQSLQMAFVMILTMPIVVIYPFLQKYYVKGVMVGSVKG